MVGTWWRCTPRTLATFCMLLVLPSQDGLRLRVLNPAADWAESSSLALPARLRMAAALRDGASLAALLDDGRVVLAGPAAGTPVRE
jgi:hypothetical protein